MHFIVDHTFLSVIYDYLESSMTVDISLSIIALLKIA